MQNQKTPEACFDELSMLTVCRRRGPCCSRLGRRATPGCLRWWALFLRLLPTHASLQHCSELLLLQRDPAHVMSDSHIWSDVLAP